MSEPTSAPIQTVEDLRAHIAQLVIERGEKPMSECWLVVGAELAAALAYDAKRLDQLQERERPIVLVGPDVRREIDMLEKRDHLRGSLCGAEHDERPNVGRVPNAM